MRDSDAVEISQLFGFYRSNDFAKREVQVFAEDLYRLQRFEANPRVPDGIVNQLEIGSGAVSVVPFFHLRADRATGKNQ